MSHLPLLPGLPVGGAAARAEVQRRAVDLLIGDLKGLALALRQAHPRSADVGYTNLAELDFNGLLALDKKLEAAGRIAHCAPPPPPGCTDELERTVPLEDPSSNSGPVRKDELERTVLIEDPSANSDPIPMCPPEPSESDETVYLDDDPIKGARDYEVQMGSVHVALPEALRQLASICEEADALSRVGAPGVELRRDAEAAVQLGGLAVKFSYFGNRLGQLGRQLADLAEFREVEEGEGRKVPVFREDAPFVITN